jgi:hypothetical protein
MYIILMFSDITLYSYIKYKTSENGKYVIIFNRTNTCTGFNKILVKDVTF